MSEEEKTEELDDGIIELIDEEDNVVKFRLLDVTEYKGEKYTLLLAAEPNDDIAEDEVVIFRLNEDEETLEPIEDEELLQEVFDFYQSETEGEDVYVDPEEGEEN
ncbi:MAG TPA: DUF1292 domain-containing protein [Candidatus Coproplasma stercoravium]|nr:DUF1292 domain-containing protein [Candidatus Coproplasma stercoravium]